jgi:hypothetical protein
MLPFDDFSWLNNIMVQNDRQEDNSVKAIKESKKKTQQTKSDFINGIENWKCIKKTKSK